MRPLDDRDRRILDLLRRDARMPLKTLAAQVGLARSSLRERLTRLEADGVIRGYRVDVAEDEGLISAYLLVRLKKTPALAMIEGLRGLAEVRHCASVAGDIDLIVQLEAGSVDRINAVRDEIAGHPDVASLTTSIVLRRDIG
jgi:DNA-binding Lrp family transcriptional regulator